jgi:ABC-type transporter Mla MlaB component
VTVLDVHRSGTTWQLAGSLDADGGRALLREIEQARADVLMDGSGLQRIDGAGLTALAVARLRCRANGHTFAVTEIAPEALRELRVGPRLLELFGPTPARDARNARFLVRRRHDGTTP